MPKLDPITRRNKALKKIPMVKQPDRRYAVFSDFGPDGFYQEVYKTKERRGTCDRRRENRRKK
jgi:hypothetical protein